MTLVQGPPDSPKGQLLRSMRAQFQKPLFEDQVLDPYREDIDFLFDLGIVYCDLRRHEDSIKAFKAVVNLDPARPMANFNLGVNLQKLDRNGEAIEAYEREASITKVTARILNNIGVAHCALGDIAQGELSFRTAIGLDGDDFESYSNLGNLQMQRKKYLSALLLYQKALELKPDLLGALQNLAIIYRRINNLDKAKEVYKTLLSFYPKDPQANHLLAAIEGKSKADPNRDYVEKLFDRYASEFDNDLGNLQYQVPSLVYDLVHKYNPKAFDTVLDLGCGTGLVGERIQNEVRKIVGVDISGEMIKEADSKNIYHGLVQRDICEYLVESQDSFSLISVADVLPYIDDVDTLFSLVSPRLTTDGLFVFSFEKIDGDGVVLQPSGRYGHGHRSVEKACSGNGLKVIKKHQGRLRNEAGKELLGEIWLTARGAQAPRACD